MVKKFGEFNIGEVKDNEREHFERELNARKKMREEKSEITDSNFDDLKSFITKEISEGEDYHISTGKRVIEVDGIKEDEIHIEYESPQLGRIRIFKPQDTSTKGYYEVNGKMFHEDGNEIRNFYHYLSLEVVNKEQVPVTENKIYRFDEFVQEGIFSDRYKDEDEDEDDNYSGIISSRYKKDRKDYDDEDINVMSHLKDNDDKVEEGLKEIALGVLLFLASCTNVQVTNPEGKRVITPAEMEIKGYVEKETYLPSKGNYYQVIIIKGDDGNTYKYKINSHPFLSKSYKINDKDSVRMVFDENGDSKIYKIKK